MTVKEMAIALGPKPLLAYAGGSLDRAALRRRDPKWFDAAERDPACRGYAICHEQVVLKPQAGGFMPLFAPGELRSLPTATEPLFLGLQEGAPRIAFGIDPANAEMLKARSDLKLIDLRSIAVQGLVAPEHLAALAEAKALLQWHGRHRFCAHCGQPTQVAEAGWRRDCSACGAEHFPRTDPVVIMLAVQGGQCLLGRSPRFPTPMWSCLAGFVEPGENLEDAVRRETLEEAGIVCGRVSYFASQPWPFPMSLMIGCYAEALSTEIIVDRTELEDARWFSRHEVMTILTGRHADGFQVPPPIAIAHHILRAFVEETVPAFA
jgi:NAD+ diphosphatase